MLDLFAERDVGATWATVGFVFCGSKDELMEARPRLLPHYADPRLSPYDFSTYPYLQLAAGLPLLARAGEDAASGKLAPVEVDSPSKLWSHPTLWSYLAAGLGRGAW